MPKPGPLLFLLIAAACAATVETELNDGPDPRYRRYDDILETLTDLERRHAELLTVESIGETHLKEPIRAVKVSRRPEIREVEPAVVLSAALHANEANGTNAIMVLLDRLLDGYGRDPAITAMIDGLEIWLVPVVNPDGHRHVFSGAPGWEKWRKNARDNGGKMIPGFVFSPGPGDGVDLNRNWDHNWDGDPSVDPTSRNYKGAHPMSEPEVLAMAALIRREMPVLVVDFHSPGKITPPNRIFWPWLEKGTGKLGPDAEVYHEIAAEMAARTETEDDGVFYDGDGYGFDTLPKEQNWVYAKTGICALLVEISKRFWWEGPLVDVIAERVATGSFSLLSRALHGPGIAGRVMDAETGRPVVAEVRVEGMHDARIGPRLTEERHGAYWRFLPPGTATVTVLAEGHEPITRRIRVGEDGWTTLDFSLRKR